MSVRPAMCRHFDRCCCRWYCRCRCRCRWVAVVQSAHCYRAHFFSASAPFSVCSARCWRNCKCADVMFDVVVNLTRTVAVVVAQTPAIYDCFIPNFLDLRYGLRLSEARAISTEDRTTATTRRTTSRTASGGGTTTMPTNTSTTTTACKPSFLPVVPSPKKERTTLCSLWCCCSRNVVVWCQHTRDSRCILTSPWRVGCIHEC